jgi:hypothetical protein
MHPVKYIFIRSFEPHCQEQGNKCQSLINLSIMILYPHNSRKSDTVHTDRVCCYLHSQPSQATDESKSRLDCLQESGAPEQRGRHRSWAIMLNRGVVLQENFWGDSKWQRPLTVSSGSQIMSNSMLYEGKTLYTIMIEAD